MRKDLAIDSWINQQGSWQQLRFYLIAMSLGELFALKIMGYFRSNVSNE
ncbi:MAG: hypothetical protein M3Q81_05675 [bacterium]|nr:hypothetical protein [bacterium]